MASARVFGWRGLLRELMRERFGNAIERERQLNQRYQELSAAIESTPQSMTHYVLRGELSLRRGDREGAKADFAAAAALAEQVDYAAGWGVMEQALRDRALQGLVAAGGSDNLEA